ncbi:MAG: universal stress protein [Bradymonadaceae bacterium]
MSILVATDFSQNSIGALRFAADFARRQSLDLKVIHVVDLATSDNSWRILVESPDEIERNAIKEARVRSEAFFEESVHDDLRPPRVEFLTPVGNPIEGIIAAAKAEMASLIVAGTKGASRVQELLLGSTANRLVRQSDLPVVLCPPETEGAHLKTIVVPVDFSKASLESVRSAARLARQFDARLRLMHAFVLPEITALQTSVANVSTQLQQIAAGKKQQVDEFCAPAGLEGLDYTITIVQQPPHLAIVDFAREQQADLVCMGSHGRRGWARFFLGNTAEKVLRQTRCPIWIVHTLE